MALKITQEEFLNECKNIHKNFYIYTNTLYNKMSDKIEIISKKSKSSCFILNSFYNPLIPFLN